MSAGAPATTTPPLSAARHMVGLWCGRSRVGLLSCPGPLVGLRLRADAALCLLVLSHYAQHQLAPGGSLAHNLLQSLTGRLSTASNQRHILIGAPFTNQHLGRSLFLVLRLCCVVLGKQCMQCLWEPHPDSYTLSEPTNQPFILSCTCRTTGHDSTLNCLPATSCLANSGPPAAEA